MDKSFNSKWDQIYFNSDPVGYLYSRAHRSICHNRVEVDGPIGVGRDFPLYTNNGEDLNEGRSQLGQVLNVRNGQDRCCHECWTKYPGTQMFEYHQGPSKYYSRTINDVCRCFYKEPGETLETSQVDSSQSTGICAHEAIVDETTCQVGDNVGGAERFLQWEEFHRFDSCKEACKRLFPASIGITESLRENYWYSLDKKCWCEFGATPVIVNDPRYRTCLFNLNTEEFKRG